MKKKNWEWKRVNNKKEETMLWIKEWKWLKNKNEK